VSRVLVVDDEEAIRDAVAYTLRAEGIEVECSDNGASALAAVERRPFDLVILDLMLGDISGIEVCRRIRSLGDVPVLMLTARDDEADLVLGFEAGADDYVTKPFSMRELVSRTRAMLRRRRLDRPSPQSLRAGEVEIDPLRHEVTVAGSPIRVSPTELRILMLLAGEDRAFTRKEILQHTWETTYVPDVRACDVHIANIRKRIEPEPSEPVHLLTVRGIGYRLARP
jgi:two-component system, OmpR family, response regulator RegX3